MKRNKLNHKEKHINAKKKALKKNKKKREKWEELFDQTGVGDYDAGEFYK